jgi:hypothetical protein
MDLAYLQIWVFIRVFDFRTLYFILYYYSYRFSILGSLAFHVIAFRQASQNMHKILFYFHMNIILPFEHQYRHLGPV